MPGRILYYLHCLLRRQPRGAERQFGAIPWRPAREGIEFLLITSRRTGRWIFPKGGRIAWLSRRASAAQEAWEEAGVEGEVGRGSLGVYRTLKQRDDGAFEIMVEMYPLRVRQVLDDWPEMNQRRRRWAGYEECLSLISEPGLAPMVEAVASRAGVASGGNRAAG